MSKITITGQLTLTGGQLTAKETPPLPPPAGKELWSWGYGTDGKLGEGTVIFRSSPVQIGSLIDWASIDGGQNHSLAIKTDGTLWAWGDNSPNGNLGDKTVINKSSPVQIGALTDWASVGLGVNHSHAIKTDGTLWTWGNNSVGALGNGTTANKSSPIQIGALTDWSSVSARDHNLAVKTDGTLWAWGSASSGRLGDGTAINKSSPSQVGSLTDWSSVSANPHSLAIKTDGTLWTWGLNNFGQHGIGDAAINRSSPVQIGALTTWASIGTGTSHSLALKTDGTLWAWGYNNKGQLGDGTIITKSSPIQIGALSDWSSINVAGRRNHAIKTDGTLWSWGRNYGGSIGDGTTNVDRSSPVQIGALTDWSSIGAGNSHNLALKNE